MQSASIWLVLPLFAIAWICFRLAWKVHKSDEHYICRKFKNIGRNV